MKRCPHCEEKMDEDLLESDGICSACGEEVDLEPAEIEEDEEEETDEE